MPKSQSSSLSPFAGCVPSYSHFNRAKRQYSEDAVQFNSNRSIRLKSFFLGQQISVDCLQLNGLIYHSPGLINNLLFSGTSTPLLDLCSIGRRSVYYSTQHCLLIICLLDIFCMGRYSNRTSSQKNLARISKPRNRTLHYQQCTPISPSLKQSEQVVRPDEEIVLKEEELLDSQLKLQFSSTKSKKRNQL